MAGLGAPELIIILLVVLVLFGGAKLPKLAKSIGEASKEFKKGVAEADAPAPTPPPPPPAAVPLVEEKVTMTKAELDALLAEREAQARRDLPPSV